MRRRLGTGAILAIVAAGMWMLAIVAGPGPGASPAFGEQRQSGPASQPSSPPPTPLLQAVAARLAELRPALDDLEKAIATGNKGVALAKLNVVRDLVTKAAASANGFANVKCPIMGGQFDPTNQAANLVREWKGQKIGFCCGGCPDAWDKLTDAEKQAKLDAAK